MVRGFLALGGLSVACSAAAQNVEIPRPRQYPPAFSQFMVSSWADCRTVSVMRLGAGPERPAEMTVFEVVESGGRLRRLHHVTLKNPYLPWNWIVTGAGRFMLTIDDRWVEGQIQQAHPATTGNCLVIYDLVRGSARALAAREFLTKPAGDSWCGPWIWVDPLMNQIFLVEPEECERSGKPFIVADLPTAEVRVSSKAPTALPAGLVKPHGSCDIGWDWSSGDGLEPSWGRASQLPAFLLLTPQPTERGKAELSRLDISQEQVCFRLDKDSGSYVKCEPRLWVKRREDSEPGSTDSSAREK